eukprot:142570-Rhodomonas_salina.1
MCVGTFLLPPRASARIRSPEARRGVRGHARAFYVFRPECAAALARLRCWSLSSVWRQRVLSKTGREKKEEEEQKEQKRKKKKRRKKKGSHAP